MQKIMFNDRYGLTAERVKIGTIAKDKTLYELLK